MYLYSSGPLLTLGPLLKCLSHPGRLAKHLSSSTLNPISPGCLPCFRADPGPFSLIPAIPVLPSDGDGSCDPAVTCVQPTCTPPSPQHKLSVGRQRWNLQDADDPSSVMDKGTGPEIVWWCKHVPQHLEVEEKQKLKCLEPKLVCNTLNNHRTSGSASKGFSTGPYLDFKKRLSSQESIQ